MSPQPGEPVLPAYGSDSLAEVLPSLAAALGVPGCEDRLDLGAALRGVRHVVVVLVDALGWHQLADHPAEAPVLTQLIASAQVARPITAAFPSTTPTSLVTVGTGLPPGRHGVAGFTVAVPGTTRTLTHIAWDRATADPLEWQPYDSVFARIAAAGIDASVVGKAKFARSALTDAAYRGSTYVGAETAGQFLAAVSGRVTGADRSLVYGYLSTLDFTGHVSGVDSAAWRHELAHVDWQIGRVYDALPDGAALVITADHGMVDSAPESTVDFERAPALLDGVALLAGDPRAGYLHVVPGAAGDVEAVWREELGDRAWIVLAEQAIEAGWFGPPGGFRPAVRGRIGDVIVCARGNLAIPQAPGDTVLLGQHGSLTAAEMHVPLIVAMA